MQGKSILVVDDEKTMRQLLTWTLQMDRYVIHTADGGVAALRHLEQHHCDLLITDYNMPEMDGLELTKEIRTRFPSVPILVVTGEASFHDLIRNGATACLAKPFDADELLEMVSAILDGKESSA